VGLVQHPLGMGLGFGQHLVAIGHILVRHLLGVRQDPDGLDVGVPRAGTGRATGFDDAPPQPSIMRTWKSIVRSSRGTFAGE
jgi:hypothetical protein